MNPLFNQMQPGGQNLPALMQRFQQFRSTLTGDPRQQVQSLLNSGRVTQSQYDNAVRLANQLQRILGGK